MIAALANGLLLNQNIKDDGKLMKFYKKGEIIDTAEESVEVLETGVFAPFEYFNADGVCQGVKWMILCQLHEVDRFIPDDPKEMEDYYIQLIFICGMAKIKKLNLS